MNAIEEEKSLLKKIRHIEFRAKQLVSSAFSGEYVSHFRGNGMEFSEIKEYNFGDDIRSIDWKVSSRLNKVFVKKYQEERENVTFIILDSSASMRFGSSDKSRRDIAAELAAVLAFSAIKSRDKVGLLLFGNEVEQYIPPSKGYNQVLKIIRAVLTNQSSGKTNIKAVVQFLKKIGLKRQLYFFISDFLIDSLFADSMRLLANKNVLIALHLYDKLEMTLPNLGLIDFKDIETGEQILVDSSSKRVRKEFQQMGIKRSKEIAHELRKAKILTLSLDIEMDYYKQLLVFFKRIKRYFI